MAYQCKEGKGKGKGAAKTLAEEEPTDELPRYTLSMYEGQEFVHPKKTARPTTTRPSNPTLGDYMGSFFSRLAEELETNDTIQSECHSDTPPHCAKQHKAGVSGWDSPVGPCRTSRARWRSC